MACCAQLQSIRMIVGPFSILTPPAPMPTSMRCSRCEHDWAAKRLQGLTLLDAVDLPLKEYRRA
jgi:hypothetical protein